MYRRKRQMLIGNWKPLCGIDPMLVLEFSMLVLESCPTQTIDLFLSGANISFRNAVAMSIDPEWNMIQPDIGRIEKWILRNAFDDDAKPYLPKHILYRQKEQFNDGVGYSWIDGLKDHANQQVTNSMLANVAFVYPENTPTTKEAYYYWTIFEKFFPKIHTDSEELLIIKTRESLLNALTNHVKANHEYKFVAAVFQIRDFDIVDSFKGKQPKEENAYDSVHWKHTSEFQGFTEIAQVYSIVPKRMAKMKLVYMQEECQDPKRMAKTKAYLLMVWDKISLEKATHVLFFDYGRLGLAPNLNWPRLQSTYVLPFLSCRVQKHITCIGRQHII